MDWCFQFSSLNRFITTNAILIAIVLSLVDPLAADDKSSPEALALYADAANFQNNGAFELAAEEWGQFLKKFPQDPLAAKAWHYSGVCNVQLKRYDRATQDFAKLIKDHPRFENLEDAYLNLGWCYYKRADEKQADSYSQAVTVFQKLIQAFPEGKLVDQAYYFLGESLYGQGKLADAIAAYSQLVRKFPRSNMRQQGLYALGVAQEEGKRWTEAGTSYDAFLKEFGSSDLATEVRMRKAEAVLQLGNAADAEKLFAAVAGVKDFASADHALFRQAFCAVKQDKFEAAAKLFATLTQQYPKSEHNDEALVSAGRSLYRAGKLDEAAVWLEKSLANGKSFAGEAGHWLCKIHLRNKQPAKVVAICDQLISQAEQSPFLVFLKLDQADALYELTDRRSDSIDRFLKIVEEHPQHELAPQALYNAAFACLALRKYAEAESHAARFQDTYPQDKLLPDVLYVSAESRLQGGQLAEAEAAFRKLVATHAGHSEVERWMLRLGSTLLVQKKYPDAVQYITTVLPKFKSKENTAEGLFLIGSSRFGAEQFQEAASSLEASLSASASWRQADECLLLLARCQQKLGQPERATATARKVLSDYPESRIHDQVYYRIAEDFFATGHFAESQREYERLMAKFPESPLLPFALHGQGWALVKQEQFKPAIKAFGDLLDKYSAHSLTGDTWLARALSRRKSGDFKGAIGDVNSFLKTDPPQDRKSNALFERGLAEVALGDSNAAIQTFSELLRDDSSYSNIDQVLYELAWAYKQQKNSEQALATFTKITKLATAGPFAAEAFFHVAEDQYDNKSYADAVQTFARGKKLAKEGELAEKISYKLGWSYFQLQQFEAASNEFRDFLRNFPASTLHADCLFMSAESLFKQQRYKEALAGFQAASKTKPSSQQMEILNVLHAGQCAAQLKQWDLALTTLTQLERDFPDSPYWAEAVYEQGWAKHNLGRSDDALTDLERAASKSRDQVGARSRFMMGEILFEKKQFEEASKQFQRVMFGFGGDNSSAEVKVWQAKAAHEAARCAEVQIQSATDPKRKSSLAADARKYYEYLVSKHPQNGLASQAKRRLEEIKKL